jgi:hypothetical protein
MSSFIVFIRYCSDNIKKAEKSSLSSTHGSLRSAYKFLAAEIEGKGPLRRPVCTWMDNINIHLSLFSSYA